MVVNLSLGNLWNSLFTELAVAGAVCVTIGIGMSIIMGWQLGTVESVAVVMLAGYALDYILFMTKAYNESHQVTRDEKTRVRLLLAWERLCLEPDLGLTLLQHMLADLGISSFAGMMSNVLASVWLWGCVFTFFNSESTARTERGLPPDHLPTPALLLQSLASSSSLPPRSPCCTPSSSCRPGSRSLAPSGPRAVGPTGSPSFGARGSSTWRTTAWRARPISSQSFAPDRLKGTALIYHSFLFSSARPAGDVFGWRQLFFRIILYRFCNETRCRSA